MKRVTTLAVVLGLAFASPAAAAEIKPDAAGTVGSAATKALSEAGPVPSGSKAASVAKKRKTKRYKLPVQFAYDVTYETALYAYLADIDAYWYNAYGCRRNSPYAVTCIGEYGGTVFAADYSSAQDWSCDWYQDVWSNRKNEVRTRVYQVECYWGATY